MKPNLKPPGTKRLNLKCDILLSTSAFNFNLRRYTVVASCGTGVTACILALGAEIAGRPGVPVYDGSWTEWGAEDSGCPVEANVV